MKNFGIAFGVIVATVIGGALLLDHTSDAPEKTASPLATPSSRVTESTASPASVASTNGAGETTTNTYDANDNVLSVSPLFVWTEMTTLSRYGPTRRTLPVTPVPSEGLKDAIRWYIDNQEWVQTIRSGDYLKYYEKQYGARLAS